MPNTRELIAVLRCGNFMMGR